jgi:hypothetical protein
MVERRKFDNLAGKLEELSPEDLKALITAIMSELARRDHRTNEPGTTQAGLDYLDALDGETDWMEEGE